MYTLLRKFIAFMLLPALLFSCNIEKRRYTSGYHVDWHHQSARVKQTKQTPLANDAKGESEIAALPKDDEPASSNTSTDLEGDLVASNNDRVAFPATKKANAIPQLVGKKSTPDHTFRKASILKKLTKHEIQKKKKKKKKGKKKGWNKWAVSGFAVGLLALFQFFLAVGLIYVIINSVIALSNCSLGMRQLNNSPKQKGLGFAIAGFVIALVVLILAMIVLFSI